MPNILKRRNLIHVQLNQSTLINSKIDGKAMKCSQIIGRIEDIKRKLKDENEFFNRTTDSDLTESSIYRTISLEREYDYWLKQARENGIIFSLKKQSTR